MKRFFLLFAALTASLAAFAQAPSITVIPPPAGTIAGNPNQVFVIVGDRFNAELRRTATYLQWRGDSTKAWQNLVPLTALMPTSMPWDSLLSKPSVITNLQSLLDAKATVSGLSNEIAIRAGAMATQSAAIALKYDSTLVYPKTSINTFLGGKVGVSGSYANPTWLTALAWTKLTGVPTTLAGFGITDPIVLASGTYANPGWITSLAWGKLTGTPTSLSGYGIADPVALTSGNYANPAWIASLAWAKLTGVPTTLAGYGITDPIVTTAGTYADPTWITSLAWGKVSGRPTTLAGYGITDAVGTGGGYSNPTWLTGLAWSKISGTPTTLAGYGISDPVVLTSNSYPNPTWLTALAWAKLTGVPTTLSGYGITDPIVLTSNTYANPGWLTALAWGKITGNPTTLAGYGVTDGVSTGGSYSNPTWLTALAWSKLIGVPTTVNGFGITDGVSTGGSYANPSWITSLVWAKITGAPNVYSTIQAAGSAQTARGILNFGTGFTVADNTPNTRTDVSVAYGTGAGTATQGNDTRVVNAEQTTNKASNLTSPDNTKYPTTQAVVNGLAGKQDALGYTAENSANKGTANGYAPLDATGKVPSANLPAGGTNYQTAQNAGSDLTQRAKVNYANGLQAVDNSGSTRTDVSVNVGNGLQVAGGKLLTAGNWRDVQSYGVVGDATTNDTSPLQTLLSSQAEGQTLLVTGKPLVRGALTLIADRSLVGMGSRGQLGIQTDSLYSGNLLQMQSGTTATNVGLFYNKNARVTTDTTMVGFVLNRFAFDSRFYSPSAGRFPVGMKISGYRHYVANFLAWDGNYGIWAKANLSTTNSDAGALVFSQPNIRNMSQAAIFADGYVTTTTIDHPTLENNRIGIWARNGAELTVNTPYIGDGARYGIRLDGGTMTVNGDITRIIQGAAGYSNAGETPRTSTYDGAGAYVTAGKLILRNVYMKNPIWYGTGYSALTYQGTPYSGGINRGSALYVAAGAEIELSGHVITNGIAPIRGTGRVTGRKLRNFITGGSLTDTLRLPHVLGVSLPAQTYSNSPTPLGGYAASITAPGGVYYRIPDSDVGKTFYLVVWYYGGDWQIGQSGQTGFGGRTSVGWTTNVTSQYPVHGLVTINAGYNLAFPDPVFTDQPLMCWIPLKITQATGVFNIYTSTTLKLAGMWLTDADNVSAIGYEIPGGFEDFYRVPVAAATPTLGTWKLGDEALLYDRTALGYSHLVCTVAGTPGTWRALAANDASLLTKGLLPPARLPASSSYDPWQQYRYFNDFTNNASSTELGVVASGTGAAVNAVSVGTAAFGNNAIGVIELNTGTTASGYASFAQSANSIINTSDSTWIDGVLAFPALPSVTQQYTLVFGFGTIQSAAAQSNGAYFNLTYNSGVELTAKTSQASSTTSTTLTAPSASTAYKYRVVMVTGTVKFYVNGALVATNTANVVSTSQPVRAMATCVKSVGTTAVAPQFDAILVGKNLASTRF